MNNQIKEIWILVFGIYISILLMAILILIVADREYDKGYADGLNIARQSEYGAGVNIVVDVNYTPTNPQEAQEEPETEKAKEYLGKYKLTAYCPCEKCCGVNTGITATGTKATEGRTIGVNPKDIPYGTVVVIDGKEYVAEDTGGAIGHNHIDIFFNNHEDAINFGTKYADVYKVVE